MKSKDDNNSKTKNIPKIRKSSLAPPGINLDEKTLFDTVSIETNATQFNIVQPNVNTSDTLLRFKNPKLLAIGNKVKITKSYNKGTKSSNKIPQSIAPIGQGITSLLSNKPLADLPRPPMEIIENSKAREEAERLSIDFHEDPVAYFSKRKDGRGHLFIYMKHAKDPKDLDYSPYELVKVPQSEVKNNYFTMSANGITHFDVDGNTENFSLDTWAREESIFKSIRKLKFFQDFHLWKPLRLWRSYIMKQRYNVILDKVIDQPTYYNASFPSVSIAFSIFKEKLDKIIVSNLLCLYPTKKYTLEEFKKNCETNLNSLKDEYTEFISEVSIIINQLNNLISDPQLLKVRDNEFDEIRRRNPNISQLVVLERKKDMERIKRKEQMNSEVEFVSNYLRMVDYMLLESLRESCFKAFENAELNCMQEQSAIFQLDIFFADNGEISFKPLIDDLKNEVRNQLEIAFAAIEELPRLLKATSVRQILRNSPNIDIPSLFEDGPDFLTMITCSSLIEKVKNNILSIISNDFKESQLYANTFKEFYPLYNLGKTWNTKNLIVTSSGEVYKGTLSLSDRLSTNQDDEFLLHPERAPIINFNSLKELISKLNFESERVGSIKAGSTRGILHIDSRNLKSILTPIPMKSLSEIYKMLKDLMNFKTEILNRVFKNYITRLKTEPTTLQDFVDFCDLLQRTQDLIPQMKKEITFIDELIALICKMGDESLQNNLYQHFHAFQSEQENALQVKNANHERFEFLLSQLVKQQIRKINKYKDRSFDNIPISVNDTNSDFFSKETMILKSKVEKFIPIIQNSIRYQEILKTKITDFPEMKEIEDNVNFAEKLTYTTKLWDNVSMQLKDIPFSHVDINKFVENSKQLDEDIENLRKLIKKPSPFLSELSVYLQEFSPYLEQLSQLSSGKMQSRHWNQLFKQCGQEYTYNAELTIQQLLSLGILSNSENIKEITVMSQGEFQLEFEFSALKTHWDEVELPLNEDLSGSKNGIRLGPLELLLNDINNTSIQLNLMMKNKFVPGIYDNVYSLAQNLNSAVEILDKWQKFEKNWIIISNLEKKTNIFALLPSQKARFELIEEKWNGFVNHIDSNQKLLQVCSYPNLFEDFVTSNDMFEIVFESLSEFVDKKRELIPRLYFLSNDEIINLYSTTDFYSLTSEVVKMMMHISNLDVHSEKTSVLPSEANPNFPELKIHGVIGEDGDTLPFMNMISCSSELDEWLPMIFTSNKEATKEALAVSLSLYESTPLNEWIMTVTSYIAVLTLHVRFNRDIEDCFNILEANPKGFVVFQNSLRQRINDLINLMTTPLSSSELGKVSVILTNVISNFERTKLLCERLKDSSAQKTWHDTLKFKYDASAMDITILFGDYKWNHGHEYWGKVPKLMMTPAVEHALLNMCQARAYDQIPLIFGPFGAGKKELINTFAFYLGNYVFSASAFPSISNYFFNRVLKGAALSGSWVLFSEIDKLSPSCLSFMFDSIRAINDAVSMNMAINNIYLNFNEINQNSRIFLTTSLDSFFDGKLPPQLRSYVRPISLSSPLVKRILETKLITCGFLSSKEISSQLESFVSAVIPIFNLTQSKLQHCLKIAQAGQDLLRQLMHSNKVDFLNYYEDSRTAEHFTIAKSAYIHIKSIIDERNADLLIKILYSHFRLFESFIKFQEFIKNPCSICLDKIYEVISDVITNETKSVGIANYMIEKAIILFQMMITSHCIIICGPPNSGKSLLIELMEKAYASMVSDADIINQFKGIRPWKVCTIYQNSNTWDNIFGFIHQDEAGNSKWNYGVFQTILAELNNFQYSHHRILRFDGEMTNDFSKFLYQFVSEDNKFRTNSLGSFAANSSFHCIVETDDVSHLTPELLSVCSILPMKSLQIENGVFQVNKTVSLPFPSYPFSNVSIRFKDKFSDEELEWLLGIFIEISPKIIQKVVSLPCLIDLKYLSDKFAEKAGIYALQYILDSKINILESKENARFLMIRGFFDIFSSILESDQIQLFDSWMCEEFNLPILEKWNEFEVNEQFVEMFPKPTLSSCQIIDNKVSPIDHSLLSSRVLVHNEDNNGIPIFINDFVIPNANFLVPSIIFEASIQTHSNILLFGPSFSGKSSILSYMLHSNPNVCPIEISLTPLLSTNDIIEIIQTQTNLIRKLKINLDSSKLYGLIFSNIDSADSSVLEFIRQLMSTSKIQLTSKIDPKNFDEIPIENYFIVIKATNISHLPNRFISQFTPIQLHEYSTSTKMYICKKAMNAFGINNDLTEIMNVIIDLLDISLSNILMIIIRVSHVPQRSAASDGDKIAVFQIILSEVYFICFNCDNEKFDEFLKKAKSKIEQNNFGDALEKFEKERIFAVVNYNFATRTAKFVPRIIKLNDDLMINKLSDFMHSNVSNLTLSNFIKLSISLLKPGNNCIISSITGSARIAMCKLFSSVFGFNFVDLDEETKESFLTTIKTNVKAAITDNKTQLFVMRVNENNIYEYDLLCSILGKLNICHLFSTEEIDSLIMKCEQSEDKIDVNKRREWMNKVRYFIHCRCRLVIAKDCEINENREIFDNVRIIPPTRESICENFIDKPNLRNLFISIWKRIDQFMPIHHYNQFYDFVSKYSKFSESSIFESNIEISTALEFLNRLSTEKTLYIESLESMEPNLESIKKNYEEKKIELDSITKQFKEDRTKLNDEKKLKEKELRKKKKELKSVQESLKNDENLISESIEGIRNLTEKDVGPIKLSKVSSFPSLKMILEILCILTGTSKEKTEEMLQDPQFPQNIVEINSEEITQEMVDQINEYLSKEELQKASMESVAPILSTILQFIQALFDNATHLLSEKSIKTEIEIRQNDLNEFLQKMKEEEKIIEDKEKENQPNLDSFNEIQKNMENMQNNFDSIQTQKNKIEQILSNFGELTQKWKNYTEIFKNCNDRKCGDSILFALYLSCCGVCNIENRKEIIKAATEELIKENIATSFRSPYEEILAALTQKLTVTIANVELPHNILIEIEHIFNAPQPPLLIDPDGIIINSFLNANKAYIISINSSGFVPALVEAMKEGKTLFITDVDHLNKRISVISRLMQRTDEITLNNFKFTCHPNFRPIYVTNISEPDQIPVELLTRTTVINSYSSCLTFCNNSIKKIFINHFEPIHASTLSDISKAETAKNLTIIQLENEILQLLHKLAFNRQKNEKYSYLDDNETIDALIDAKNRYKQTREFINSANESFKNMEESLNKLKPIISLCSTMWFCLSRYMPKVQPYYKFNFPIFLKSISNALHDCSNNIRTVKLTDQQQKDLRKNLLNLLLKSLNPSLTLRDSIFFMFLTAFMSQQKNLADLTAIISNLQEKIGGKYFIKELQSGQNNDNDIIERLKNIEISQFFDLAMTFVLQFFGDDFMHNFPIFRVENTISQASTIPTMIITDDKNDDVTRFIISFVKSRLKMDNFVNFSLSDDQFSLKTVFDGIKGAMNRGSWVLLHYWTPSLKSSEVLNELLFLLHSCTIHSNFRLIINCHTTEFLSPYLIMKCQKLMIESYPSIKQTMQAAYEYLSSQIASNNSNMKLLKRIFYFSALTFASINFRTFLKPIGFKMFIGNQITSLNEIIDYIKPLLNGGIPMRNLRDFVQEIAFGSQIIETQDRRCLRSILSSVYRNTMLDDNFTFLDPSSNESSIWIPVLDGALVTYQGHPKSMPLFQTTDILLISRKTGMLLLRWKMSLYLSRPFLSILSNNDELDELDEEEVEKKFKDTSAAIPSLISDVEDPKMVEMDLEMSPLLLFWIKEIDFLNSILVKMNEDINSRSRDIQKDLIQDKVPKSWSRMSRIPTIDNLKQFIIYLGEKRKFLQECLNEPFIEGIDIRLVDNIKGFFAAYQHEFAFREGIDGNGLSFQFAVIKENESRKDCLILKGLFALNGVIKNDKLALPNSEDSKCFFEFPPLKVTLSNIGISKRGPLSTFVCPLYKYIFMNGCIDPDSLLMFDGETQNYIMDIFLPTDLSDRSLLLNGTALYIHIPQNFL